MKQDTKETIGSRGTVAGFRPLIGEERWHRGDFTTEMLEGGWRPLLSGEATIIGDQWNRHRTAWSSEHNISVVITETSTSSHHRTRRPLPPPQVETFEAHGHVWYRHVPGDAQPVEDDAACVVLYESGSTSNAANSSSWRLGDCGGNIIGYRFPDFPAVHTTLQQQQPIAQPSADTQDITKQRDACWRSLLAMYHGWCDVAPDSVAECIADVAKVLYPTDAERCEAEFQKWYRESKWYGSGYVEASDDAWKTAWNAAKQQKP